MHLMSWITFITLGAEVLSSMELKVFVNGLLLVKGGVDYGIQRIRTQYVYTSGDATTVECEMFSSESFTLAELSYALGHERIGVNDTTAFFFRWHVLGIHTILRAAHNGSTITYSLSSLKDLNSVSINVMLMMAHQGSYDGILNLKVNSVNLRYQNPLMGFRTNSRDYNMTYLYKPYDILKWECGTTIKDVVLQAELDGTPAACMVIEVNPGNQRDQRRTLTFVARYGIHTLRKVYINFYSTQIGNDETPLFLNLTGGLYNIYKYNGYQREIYYWYDKNEYLVLNCSTLSNVTRIRGLYLVFGDITEINSASIVRRIHLTAASNNTDIVCSLVVDDSKIRNITVFFRMRYTTEETSHIAPAAPLADTSYIGEIIGGSACVAGVVLVAALVFYCRRRQIRGTGSIEESFEMREVTDQSRSLPPVPRQPSIFYDYAYQVPHEYCEIADVRPQVVSDRNEQQRVAEAPGIQNTLYYSLDLFA